MNIENGTVALAYRQLCRLCLGREGELVDMFAVQQTAHQAEPLAVRIQGCLQLDITQHDTLPKWICKQCLDKIDDFTSFRERCKQNERKLLLGAEEPPVTKDADHETGDVEEQTDDEEEEEMEMIVIDPSRDYESSNDSLSSEVVRGEENGTDPYRPAMVGEQREPHPAEEEEAEGSEAEEGEEEEEEEEDEELKCDTAPGGDAQNGLTPYAGNANAAPRKTVVFTCKYCDHASCIRCGAVYTQKDKLYDHERYCMGKPPMFGLAAVGTLLEPPKQDVPLGGLGLPAQNNPPQPPPMLVPEPTHVEAIAVDQPNYTAAVNTPQTPPSSKIYNCTKCPKRFLSKASLRAHQSIHPAEVDTRMYECTQCRKQIVGKRSFDRHLQTHNELKAFGCATCGKRFSRRDKLRRHERIHQHTDRQFTCPNCSAKFVRKDAYESHLKIHCNPAMFGDPTGQEMTMMPMALQQQQHSLLYSMIGAANDDGTMKDPSIRM
uniref:Protein krueppel n=1 Tax=Anopheles epiroticus TaxID=199890 RepID=A0A182P2R6_9DIPT